MIKVIFLIALMNSMLMAQPSKAFEYLMDEPLTMLEWGVYKMEKAIYKALPLNEQYNKIILKDKSWTGVNYSFVGNQLLVNSTIIIKKNAVKQSKKICKAIVQDVRKFYFVNDKSLRRWDGIGKYFRHNGFSSLNTPKNLQLEIERNVYIHVNIRAFMSQDDSFSKVITSCEAPLLGEKYCLKNKCTN